MKVLSMFSWCRQYLFANKCDLFARYGRIKSHKCKEASWAVVTGATGSIGFSYCKAFAEEGFNIVLIARNKDKAASKGMELKKLYPNMKTHIIISDLASLANKDSIATMKHELKTFLQDNDIAVLINNAGRISWTPKFGNVDLNTNLEIMNVNMYSSVILTQLLLPYFIRRNTLYNTYSLVINIGSCDSYLNGFPGINIYVATKTFIDSWSVTASKEYEKDKIDIFCDQPGIVESNMSGLKKNILFGIIDSDSYVESSLNHINGKQNIRHYIGYWLHHLSYIPLKALPINWQLTLMQSFVYPFVVKLMNSQQNKYHQS